LWKPACRTKRRSRKSPKYADGLPLYRQEASYLRDGVALGRSPMAQWMGVVGFHLEPLARMCSRASARASGSSPTKRRCPR
jgi:transposase